MFDKIYQNPNIGKIGWYSVCVFANGYQIVMYSMFHVFVFSFRISINYDFNMITSVNVNSEQWTRMHYTSTGYTLYVIRYLVFGMFATI